MGFLDDYEPVEDRIRAFYDDHPEGRITTTLLDHNAEWFIVHAAAYRPGEEFPSATGLAREAIGDSNVNKKSALENCETSAIGRALANLGYAPKGKRPSREEMSKVQPAGAGEGAGRPGRASSHPCPSCGSEVQDNREEHFSNSKKPAWRCSNRGCTGGKPKNDGGFWGWASWNPEEFDGGEAIKEDYEEAPFFPPGEEPF